MFSFLFFLFPSSVHAASTYYVSTSGSDTNPGTLSQPWKTIQKAADTMAGGDTVIVTAGDYPAQRVIISKSGSQGNPITYQAQGTVTLHGGFRINSADYITLEGFDITDTPDSSSYWRNGAGIFVEGKYCDLENNYIHFATWSGIFLNGTLSNPTLSTNCIVRNNRLYKNGQNGITVNGRNHLIEGNEIWGTIQHHPSVTNPPSWVDADGIRFFGSGHVFRGNYIHDIKYGVPENIDPHIDCFQTYSDTNFEIASYIIFEQNWCDNAQAQALEEDGQGFMIEQGSGSTPPTNITIRNNVIKAYLGLNIHDAQNSVIVFNTIINDLTLSDSYYPDGIGLTNAPNAIIENNLLYDMSSHSIILRDTVSQSAQTGKNLEYRSDGKSLVINNDYYNAARRANDLWGVNPLLVNPYLTPKGDYHLTSTSPAINAGVTLTSVTNDYDGTTRPQGAGYDIGVYEYVVPTTPSPSPTPFFWPGDINHDSVVNIQDYTLLSNAFGTANPAADLNSDGIVNVQDYILLSNNFGKSS